MITFYGQPRFALATLSKQAVGYELLIRQHINVEWRLPEDLTKLPPEQFQELLEKALRALPPTTKHVSFNLERVHFVDPRFLKMVQTVQANTPVQLIVELTERHDARIDNLTLVAAAKRFFDAGIAVCIDDVGSGNNLPGVVEALTPYATAYKFGMQNLRLFTDTADLNDRLAFWAAKAAANHKQFDVSGVESLTDLDQLKTIPNCEIVQGYFFGQPVPLETAQL